MNVTISKMEVKHLDQVMEIEKHSFVSPWSRNLLLQELRSDIAAPFVALMQQRDEELVVGYVCAWIIQDEINILKIACHPHYRRRGIGRQLLEHCLRNAAARDVHSAVLEVRPSNNPALLFYQACGFMPAGVRRGYYQETGEDAIVMLLYLREYAHDSGKNPNERAPLTQ